MILLLAAALAGPCGTGGRPVGPLTVALETGGLGAHRTACLRSEASIGGGGSLLVDTADFYGRLRAVGAIDGRARLGKRVELFGRLEAARFDSVIAPIAVSTFGIGGSSLGLAYSIQDEQKGATAVHTRFTFPTQAGLVHARPWSAEVGFEGSSLLWKHTALHGNINLLGQTMSGRGPSLTRFGLNGVLGIEHRFKLLSLVLDLPVSVGWNAPFDYVGVKPGVRFGGQAEEAAPKGLGFELGVFLPLLGAERTLAALDLRVNYRFN